MKTFIIIAAINAAMSVACGAFGAHGLEGKISEKSLAVWKTAVQYQMFHAGGLLAIGLLWDRLSSQQLLNWSGWVMLIGIILFSGSLYVLSVASIGKLGIITPFGGVAFIASWILMIVAVYKYS